MTDPEPATSATQPPPDNLTARVFRALLSAAIRAKYAGRRAPLAVAVRDRLGQWMADELFAAAFGVRGRPGWPPSRLAVVTVLQMAENLGDRQAAEAVRTRLDWQYALGLGLDDPGFDHSVLSEFRGRVAAHGLEEAALDALLAKLAADGLIAAGGKQRTDSTHVIAAVRALHTTELAGESVRAALEALAAACPDWLAARFCVSDWDRRYGAPVTTWRRPAPGKAERDKAALQYARDGYALVAACYEEAAPPWLREVPAVQVLRTVLIQSFTRTVDEDGQEVISRREPGGDGIPPAHIKISSPYDAGARWGGKKDLSWPGYKLHISETCEDPPACGCLPGPATAGSGRCGHDVRPNLITGVATTRASVAGAEMTTPVNAALARRDLARAGTTSTRDTARRATCWTRPGCSGSPWSPRCPPIPSARPAPAMATTGPPSPSTTTPAPSPAPRASPAPAGPPSGRKATTGSSSGSASPPAVPARPASCAPPPAATAGS